MADIENTLAVAKDSHVIVYNAPNDETGQTELDEYTAIANQDRADTVSSSWGVCENDVTAGYVQAENTIFEQMAFQGQSMFSSSGDTGAFGCIRSDGTTIVDQGDPSSQPWVTSVGGTSLRKRQPGHQPEPRAAGHGHARPSGTSATCAVQRRQPRATTTRAASSGARRRAPAAADPASTGAGRSTRWGRA